MALSLTLTLSLTLPQTLTLTLTFCIRPNNDDEGASWGGLRTMWGRDAEGDLDLVYRPHASISLAQRVRTVTAPGPHLGVGTLTCFQSLLKFRSTGGCSARAGSAPFAASNKEAWSEPASRMAARSSAERSGLMSTSRYEYRTVPTGVSGLHSAQRTKSFSANRHCRATSKAKSESGSYD
jgi:hypothetical protein